MLSYKQLSPAQQEVLRESASTYFVSTLFPHIRMPMPLIVGPSGSGKTTIAQCAAEAIVARHRRKHPQTKAATLSLNTMSWVVRGSSSRRNTIQVIVNALWSLSESPDSLLVIVMDEIDKLVHASKANHNSSWFTGVMQEVQELVGLQPSLLEGVTPEDVSVEDLSSAERRTNMRQVYQNTFVFAAGAFQGGFTGKQNLGFHGGSPKWGMMPDSTLFDHFRKALGFDDNDLQLFSRFRWHLLPPPTKGDLMTAVEHMARGAAEELLRPELPGMVTQAMECATPYRMLESLLFEAGVRLAATRRVPPLEDPITARHARAKSGASSPAPTA